MTMIIRQAGLEDAADIAVVIDVVQKIHAEAYPEVFKYPADPGEVADFFRQRIEAKDNFIFLAFFEGKFIGYVWVAIEHRKENAFKYEQEMVYIHQIAVSLDFRFKGIGRALMEKVDAFAREEGIRNIALDSWAFNHEAHSFFNRLGFETFNIKMEKIL